MENELENLEDYEAVNDYVDALLAGQRPPAPRITGPRAAMLRFSAVLNSVTSRQTVPTQPFVDDLAQRLALRGRKPSLLAWRMDRRRLLAGFAGAFSLLFAGGLADRLVVRLRTSSPGPGWTAVAHASELAPGMVKRFAANDVVGHVMNIGGKIWALSAVCTHQACLLDWEPQGQMFACTCHGAAFNADGSQHPIPSYERTLQPLPRIPVAVLNGTIFVKVAALGPADPPAY